MPAFATSIKHQQIVPIWDYRGLIRSLGTSASLSARIKRAGYDAPHRKTIDGWRYRGRVPGHWVPLLLSWALQSGTISAVDELLVDDQIPL